MSNRADKMRGKMGPAPSTTEAPYRQRHASPRLDHRTR